MSEVRILLADDHAVVRSGLRRLLEQKTGFRVVAEAENGDQAYQMYAEFMPDIAVLDLSMPGMGGLEAIRRILARHDSAKVLVFSMHENAAFATQALKAGVRGYVSKTGSPDELVTAVTEIMRGQNYISANVAQKIALNSLGGEHDPFHLLSTREFEIFRFLAAGKGTAEIGEKLKISQKTVANYHTTIRQKLDITSSIELIRLAMKHSII